MSPICESTKQVTDVTHVHFFGYREQSETRMTARVLKRVPNTKG